MKDFNKKNQTGGQVIMITVVAFLVISLAVVAGVAVPTAHQIKSVLDLKHSKQAYIAADSVNEEAFYRLNAPTLSISGSSLTLPFSGSTPSATAVITGGSSQKTITTTGTDGQTIRYGKSVLSLGVGVSFNYGVQTGTGGVVMGNNSQIIGNLYANGNVSGGGIITHSAIAANSVSPTPNQENNSSPADTPVYHLDFRKVAGSQNFAQSFDIPTSPVLTDRKIYQVSLFIKKSLGAIPNPTVKIVKDSGGSPSNAGPDLITTGALIDTQVTNTYGWVDVVFPSNPSLTQGQKYWIVIGDDTFDATNYYTIGANADSSYTSCPSCTVKIGKLSSTSWSAPSPASDSFFKVYLIGQTSSITGVTVGSDSSDTVWAHTITGVGGPATQYCPTCANVKPDDPAPTSFPISAGNIAFWKTEADALPPTTGPVTLGDGDHIGPTKVNGNLTIDTGTNKKAYLDGTIFVTGNLLLENNATFSLDTTRYGCNSGVIVVGGTVRVDQNATFAGTSVNPTTCPGLTNNTHILVISESTIDSAGNYAIDLSNNGGAVILYAGNGRLHVKNGGTLNQATAKTMEIDPNAIVTYVEGLADQNFTSGPSGAWNVDSWGEVASP